MSRFHSLLSSRPAVRHSVRRITEQNPRGGIQAPPPPPVCPSGWRTGPPDFVGVGAQRCGTTRWFELLGSHPEVVPPTAAKEVHYFDRFYAGGFTEADASEYHRYFPRDEGRQVGEWTPLYMSVASIPRLLARAAPEVRLLVLLRDPVERYISGIEHDSRRAQAHGLPFSQLAPVEAFARGLYHAQLKWLLESFDRSRVLVQQYELCVGEPLVAWRRTVEFLGLSNTTFVPDFATRPNSNPSKPTLDSDTRTAYTRAYHDDVVALADAFPGIDLMLWPNFAYLAH